MKQGCVSFFLILSLLSVDVFSVQADEEIKGVKISSPDKKSFLKADTEMIQNISSDIRVWTAPTIGSVKDVDADASIHRAFGL